MEVLLELPSSYMINVVEARTVIYRFMCNHQWKPKFTHYGQTRKSQDMEHEPILLTGTDKMTLRYAYHEPFNIHLPENSEWQNGFIQIRKGAWSGIRLGPKPIKALVLGCTDRAQKRALLQSWASHHSIPSRKKCY